MPAKESGIPPSSAPCHTPPTMDLADLQTTMRETYLVRDAARGRDATFRWLTEEIGELARALRKDDRANLEGVDLEVAAARYANGCPKCGGRPCTCEATG